MTPFICLTCGAHFPPGDAPPDRCPICDEERQYIGHQGQRWTTLEEMRRNHRNLVQPIEPGLTGFTTEPKFAIGEQAHLIETPVGNVLWNCNSLLDDDTVSAVKERGGLAAIAVSHPHFYTSVAEWSRAFDGAPIYLHADDRQWVTRPDEAIVFWEGETPPSGGDSPPGREGPGGDSSPWQGEAREGAPGHGGETLDPLPGSGLTLIRCGGHFAGSAVLHWPAGAEGRGALLTGDTIQVVADRRWVSFMYSYPNIIPLGADDVRRIVAAVEPYPFDRLYGGWDQFVVATDAKNAVRRSAERYLGRIGG